MAQIPQVPVHTSQSQLKIKSYIHLLDIKVLESRRHKRIERLNGPGVPGGGGGVLVSIIIAFMTTEMKGTFSDEAQTAAAK